MAESRVSCLGRHRADHCRTKQHRFRGLRRRHRLAAGVGDDLSDEGALRRPAADDDGLEVVSRALERFDNVGDPIGEPAETGDIELFEACRVVAEIESDDPAARGGVGGGGAAADERGQRMKPFGDQRRVGKPTRAPDDAALQRIEPGRRRLREGGMQAHETVDRRAERRLASVHEPLARRQRGEVRAPDRVDEARLVRHRHAAR